MEYIFVICWILYAIYRFFKRQDIANGEWEYSEISEKAYIRLYLMAIISKRCNNVWFAEEILKNWNRDNPQHLKTVLTYFRNLCRNSSERDLVNRCYRISEISNYRFRYLLFRLLSEICLNGVYTRNTRYVLITIGNSMGLSNVDLMSIISELDIKTSNYSQYQRQRQNNGGGYNNGYNRQSNNEQYNRGGYNQTYGNSKNDLEEAYQILGVNATDSDAVIRKTYLKLAMKYHPDKYETKSAKDKEKATAEFQKIQNAWEKICEARGIK